MPKSSSRDETSNIITEKILFDGNGNSSYAANISWNAERWMKTHKIEFFHVEVDSTDGRFYYTKDVPAKDGVSYFDVVYTCM